MEINSITNSATNLITNAQQKAANAAHTIATLPVQKDEVGGSSDYGSGDLFKPILSLNESKMETAAGVKLLETQKKINGALLDVRV